MFDNAGTYQRTISPTGPAGGLGYIGAALGIAVDSAGNFYVADRGNALVQKWGPTYAYLTQWSGNPAWTGNYGICADSFGNIYVSDFIANTIQKFTSGGTFLLKWGSQGTDDGQFNAPIGIAADQAGNVYVADMVNHRVQKFDSSGKFLCKFGTAGAGNGGFGWPIGVAVNPTNAHVIVTDYLGCLVQEFQPAD
jgi:DNA-binding beta-propeller fold protein YncE